MSNTSKPADRRSYRREGEERRREALVTAVLDLVAEGGPKAATVRAIAEKAGVTPGLIRHYFQSKEHLTRAAYNQFMVRMIQDNARVLETAPADPTARLAAFVAASLRPPVVDPVSMGIWAGFMHQVRSDPALREVHVQTYLGYRDLLQQLIADLGRTDAEDVLRAQAIACNGVIDGLWMEGCVLPDSFAKGELERIGLSSVGAILGIDLATRLNGAT
jgi:TetR/AcrR family transcriptional regulator, transcriptional repressor of bet genes